MLFVEYYVFAFLVNYVIFVMFFSFCCRDSSTYFIFFLSNYLHFMCHFFPVLKFLGFLRFIISFRKNLILFLVLYLELSQIINIKVIMCSIMMHFNWALNQIWFLIIDQKNFDYTKFSITAIIDKNQFIYSNNLFSNISYLKSLWTSNYILLLCRKLIHKF